jgi:hypothetical protein
MTKFTGWGGLLTFATIDAWLVFTAGAALAAPAAALPGSDPTLPTLLVLGVGLVVASLRRGVED